jgi:hypothetical protein
MSECICGKCPQTFKFANSEDEEYLCCVDEKQLFIEKRFCEEELGKMTAMFILNEGKTVDENTKLFMQYNTKYWESRKRIIDEEVKRREGE